MSYRNAPQILSLTKVVKCLMIVNVTIWLGLQVIVEQLILEGHPITQTFGLIPFDVFNLFLWQPVTYMFLHDLGPFHILINLLILWWVGSELEINWGSRFFALYYFVSGVGAAFLYLIGCFIAFRIGGAAQVMMTPVIGSSGAIFGLLLAFGIIYSERIIYFMFVFPMKAKYFVMIIGGLELVYLINNGIGGSRVANLAHLGGLISGFLFLIFWTRYKRRTKKVFQKGYRRRLKLVVDNDKDSPKYWN